MSLRFHRNWIILVIALLVGSAAAVTAMRYLDDRVADIERRVEQKTARAVVAKESLPAGERLDHDRVAVRDVPVEWLHSGAITPEQFDRAAGSMLAFPAQRGEPLLWSQLEGKRAAAFSARLAPGRRGVTLAVDEISSMSGMLEPGDTIDLLLTVKRGDGTLSLPLLQNVGVLATGARTTVSGEREDGERGYATITLEASIEDGQRIVAARSIGTITALLRAPGDRGTVPTLHRDALALLGLGEQRSGNTRAVPVIYGGAGNRLLETARLPVHAPGGLAPLQQPSTVSTANAAP